MPLIAVWQCPRTGKMFPEKAAYRTHLRALAKKTQAARVLEQRRVDLAYVIDLMQRSVRDADQIADFIQATYDAGLPALPKALADRQKWRGSAPSKLRYVGINSIRLIQEFPATHSAPKGKRPNFTSPKGYPAYRGHITFEVNEGGRSPDSEILGFYGVHMGSGGGGVRTYRYDLTLWAADFPRLRG